MANKSSGRESALKQIENQWQQLLASVNALPQEDLPRPGAVGHWSVRDMIGHVATWDRELAMVVDRYISSGEKTDYGNDETVNSSNEAEVQRQQGLTLGQLWEEVHQCHRELVEYLQGLSEEPFDPATYSGEWIATDSWGHYREHRQDIERWIAGH